MVERKFRSQIYFYILIVALFSLLSNFSIAQVGNCINRRIGLLDGNLVKTLYKNDGEITDYPNEPSGNWPEYGYHYIDGIAFIVSVATNDINGNRIHPMETQYREFVDVSPEGVPWGFEPLPGYFNPYQKQIAISDKPVTWPAFWPDKLNDTDDPGWSGQWNSLFGKGLNNPYIDLETYFVIDDDPDEEWDFYPDANDAERRGVGLEVKIRGLQSSQSQLEDMIFWIYDIQNEGTTDYDSVYVTFYIDWGVGGIEDGADDIGEYDSNLDIVFAYDTDGYGTPGNWSPVGYACLAFLDTPGDDSDGVDNDGDGMVDESMSNGIDDDGDWDIDKDDVGADGIAGTGDIGEGDGIPTLGEPNFDFTDLDEKDQIGLTGFEIFPAHKYELTNDEENWGVFSKALLPMDQILQPNNLGMFMSSGPFPLLAGETIRYSTVLVFGEDREDLFLNKHIAQQFYNSGFRLPDSLAVLSALFMADNNFGAPPLQVQFTDHSITDGVNDIVSWYWNFGDNSTSTLQNPDHIYSEEGIYDVTLIVIDQNAVVSTLKKEGYIKVDQFVQIKEEIIIEDNNYSCGACWGDYNNDDFLDLFIANGAFNHFGIRSRQNNSLYLNNKDGSFTKITGECVVTDSTKSYSACWGDYNSDGYLDLFVANGNDAKEENNCLYENNGNGTFTKISEGEIVNDGGKSFDCAWGDFNNDGYLDLYVANYGKNFLYQNNGNGSFTRITEGDIVNDSTESNCCSWTDYDNDGDIDLFIANNGNNFLYENNSNGNFIKITEGIIVNDNCNTKSCSWGDCNNDGFLDLFIANGQSIFSESNKFYINNRDGTFNEVMDDDIVNDEGNSNSCSWVDYDNDGDLDLLVINTLSFSKGLNYGDNTLYRNEGDHIFTKMPPDMCLTNITSNNIIMNGTWADYNNDGNSDLLVAKLGNNALYLNRGNNNNWIKIKCVGTFSNTAAIGTKVRVMANINGSPMCQINEITGQNGSSLYAEFGLRDATIIDSIKVEWPNGLIEIFTDIDVDQFIKIIENEGWEVVGIGEQNDLVSKCFSLMQNYPNPFNPQTTIQYQLKAAGNVKLEVYDLTGRLVRTIVDEYKQAGNYTIIWDARNVSSGIYLYRLQTKEFVSVRKCVKLK